MTHLPPPIATNQNAIVHLSKGVPVTDSLAIAIAFGRKHGNVTQSIDDLIKDRTLDTLEFKRISYIDEKGRTQRKIELTERGALIAMPFIGGKKSREGQTRLVDAFLAMRDELASPSGKWQTLRNEVSTSFRAIMDNLKAVRTEVGKVTAAHHYSNEANMLSVVTFGKKRHRSKYAVTQRIKAIGKNRSQRCLPDRQRKELPRTKNRID